MRIIPKKTKVQMEFFKGIGVLDVAVGLIGASLAIAIFLSDLPLHIPISVIVLILVVGLVIPLEDEKGYMIIYNALVYLARQKYFRQRMEEESEKSDKNENAKKAKIPTVGDITPFTGISGRFIEYGTEYYGIVVEIPNIEFRFYTESRQDQVIEHVYGSVLRSVSGTGSAAMVKLDRPIILDTYIASEQKKIEDIKEAYLNGLLSDEELTKRVAIIHDRMEQIKIWNQREKVYLPFHYLVFFHKDQQLLEGQAEDMIKSMTQADMQCRILEEKELVMFLKYNYTIDFDEREAYGLTPDQYMDWILPKQIQFASRQVKYDDLITHTFRIRDYPTMVGNAWGHSLFHIMGTRVVLKMHPLDQYKSIRQIDRAIDELRTQANETGKTSKLMELETHIDTLASVLSMLQGDNESLFDVNIYITLYDYELSEREKHPYSVNGDAAPASFKKQVKQMMAEQGFKATDLLMMQFEAYASSHISAFDAFRKESRGIHSTSIAAVFPYVHKILDDKNGICIGESDGIPVFVDFFKRDKERVNSNMVVIGKSGSGKSYATKTLLANLAAENSKIFILDPENEYYEMARNFDGKIIDVGSATQGRLNPFHIITSLEDEEGGKGGSSSYNVHLQFLEEFFTQILPGMDADAKEYLNNIIVRMYDEKGIDESTDLSGLTAEDFPIFDDLYEKILNDYQFSKGDYSKMNLRTLLNYISKFASGGRNSLLWNGKATIDTSENFIVFNFQSLLANKNNTIANAQMLLVLKWLDNEIIKNRDYNIRYHASRKIIIVIDEAHVFIDSKFPIALDFMYQLAKRIRKYNGMQIIITQNIKDFVGTEELARKSTAIINACQYSFIFPLAPNDMHDLCKLYEKAGAINESEQEDIINNGRGRAFVVTSPSERTCVSIVAEEGIERLFTV
ncbi:MAG: ATP-binding protein [Lachnospiraceae bacterium]|nr:ATP-binding protein [Lachnospiraceae bacterium]